MKQTLLSTFALLITLISFGQAPQLKPQIMSLGTFHFSYPNMDVIKIDEKSQLNVLHEAHQREIQSIADAIKAFNPTHILIEAQPQYSRKVDSVYTEYVKGNYKLKKDEAQQIGFRLGKELGLKQIYCIDEWGKYYESQEFLMEDTCRRSKSFSHYYFNNPDTIYKHPSAKKEKSQTIIENLLEANNPDKINERLGIYLIGHYKYEEKEGDYFGVDFETGRWFNRNLRIFRNIQRVPVEKDSRMLLIIGAEHCNILNHLIVCSPEYDFVSPLPYLEKAKRKLKL
jgi:hypothetical protein